MEGASHLAAGGGSREGWRGYLGFAHCSLLLTLVGISLKTIPSQGRRKENKSASPGGGADGGVQASLFPSHCTGSWDLTAQVLKSHVTPASLWN